jgi:hypothetical protein
MKVMRNIWIVILCLLGANTAMAQMDHHDHQHASKSSDFTATAEVKKPLQDKATTQVTVFLAKNGKGVGEDQLKTVHTEKVHALIIDPTLTDYQHIHPRPGKKTGEYIFDFTPRTPNNYRIWLDVTPVNGAQQYVMADLTGANQHNTPVIKKLSMNSTVDDYHFNLSFDKDKLTAGQDAMGSIMITDKNEKPVKNLEPIMEAFAHIVAFNEDYQTILHVHPMGPEPKDPSLRGGPKIDFHLTPSTPGYVKIFVQVQINGKEIIAPFGVNVN